MSRIYITDDSVRLTLRDDWLLDMVWNQTTYQKVTARSLFPVNDAKRYISILNDNGEEILILKDLACLSKSSRDAVRESLLQNYRVPKIRKILSIDEKYGAINVTAKTDRGVCSFKITNRSHNLKVTDDRRVLIRDTNDNRYEIPDYNQLNRKCIDIFLF